MENRTAFRAAGITSAKALGPDVLETMWAKEPARSLCGRSRVGGGEQQEVKPEVKHMVSTLTLTESDGGLGVVLRM